jgi:predicted small secreted protein
MRLMPLRLRAAMRRAFVGIAATRSRFPHARPREKGFDMKTAAPVAAAMMMLAGCSTIEGAGKDAMVAGSAVEVAAGKAKPN